MKNPVSKPKMKTIVVQGTTVDMVSHDGGKVWWAASLPSNGIAAGIHKMPSIGRHGVQQRGRYVLGRHGTKAGIGMMQRSMPPEEEPLSKKYKKRERARALVMAAQPVPKQIGYATPSIAYRLLQELGTIKKNAIQLALEGDD